MKSYIVKPKSVKKSAILEREYIFSASRHNDIQINSNFDFLVNLIDISKKSVSLKNQKKYFNYVEIGSINTTTGYVEPTYKKSIDISTDSVYQLQKDDILISTVRTYLGGIGIVNQKEQDFVASKALIVLRELKKDINKYYLFGILRTSFFIEQTNLILNASMYPRMDKDSFNKLKIPFPTTANHQNPEKVETLVSLIVQNIIDKEEQIKLKNKQIDELIEKELKENQKAGNFSYKYPRISEIREETRFDTGLYEREFKEEEYLIENYHNGFGGIFDLEYEISRGQNLQVSNIGLSFYSDQPKKNFYKLILSKYFTGRTFEKVSYLGNAKKLKTIKKGDIVFSCRGEMGRCVIFPETTSNTITNIDNVHISSESRTITEKLFLFCFLGYLKQKDILDSIACTGSGAPSFTQYQFSKLKIPNFPESKQQEIATLYYNPLEKNTGLDLENYLEREHARNSEVGIFQLNMEIFSLREQLEDLVHKIVMEEKIELRFEY